MLNLPTDPAQSWVMSGTDPRIGNWQPVHLLGEGRWSRVYRARPSGCRAGDMSDYAVKMVRQDGDDIQVAIRLLQREVQVAKAVSHPHLSCILSAHVHRPPYYIVMPCLDGATLKAALGIDGGLSTAFALWLIRQTTEALHAVHQADWLHADVKPSNIFVSATGHVTLLDLGLAQANMARTTRPSTPLAGTLAYCAPEWFSDLSEPTPASDIYSLGITFYRMLTGRLPFAMQSADQLVDAHLRRLPPPPRRFNPRLDIRVARLVERMLAKQAADRPTTDDLLQQLVSLEIALLDDRHVA